MFCSNCGTNNADGVKFCSNCGNPMPTPKPVEETVVASEPTPVAPAEPVAPAPVYAPVEPVAPAPAPAPAPEKPKKKNNNIIIIAIVAVIAVAAIVVGILFGTGVIGGDNKKKEEETTAKKTETTTETVKEEENKPNFKYAEVQDLRKYFIAVDDAGNPVFNEYGEVTVYETDDAGKFVYDANGNPTTYLTSLDFELNGTIYTSGMAVKIPTGWKLIDGSFVEDGICNEATESAIVFEESYGTAATLEEVAMEYVDAVDESTVSFEYDADATQINGKDAMVIMAEAVVEDDICVSYQFVIIEVDGEFYCFFFTTPDAESFDFVSFVETNVTFY